MAGEASEGGKGGRRAFLMRVRPEVLAAVESLAASELRSMNAQVEVLLREALRRRGVALKGLGDRPEQEPEVS